VELAASPASAAVTAMALLPARGVLLPLLLILFLPTGSAVLMRVPRALRELAALSTDGVVLAANTARLVASQHSEHARKVWSFVDQFHGSGGSHDLILHEEVICNMTSNKTFILSKLYQENISFI